MQDDKTIFMPVSKLTAPMAMANTGLASGFDSDKEQLQALEPTPTYRRPSSWHRLTELEYHSGINPLLEQATELFILHHQLLQGQLQELETLRANIHDALLKFELRAQELNLPKPLIKSAKYVLCAFLDEAVMSQEFARESNWSQQSLLSRFFNETWGGATVFKIRQFCLENLQDYLELLELIYLVLCLGFKGQYGTLPEGEYQLERLKRETYQVIMNVREDKMNLPLSPHATSDYDGKVTLKQNQSLRWFLGCCLLLLIIAYVSMSTFLSMQSAPVYDQVNALLHANNNTGAAITGNPS